MAKIIGVEKGGIAHELGIKAGDELIAFDSFPVKDVLDCIFYEEKNSFVMTVGSGGTGEITDYEIEKDDDEILGIVLEELTTMRCKNKCAFCFIDQLPRGMRPSLYVKDDDYRLSFVSGNYVTLTNCCDGDIERIIRLHLSPLYVSVHASEPTVKNQLIGNKNGEKLLGIMQKLAINGIVMHAQIVLCQGINDGSILQRTLSDLDELRPQLESVAIVPAGLTAHRNGLQELLPVNKECATHAIALSERINLKSGYNWVWCSDEMYLRGGLPLPSLKDYGELSQIENGVGLIRQFEAETLSAMPKDIDNKKASVTLVTGTSFAPYLKSYADIINKFFPNVIIEVAAVVNKFFGESITVAGLLTGRDIVKRVKGAENIVLPSAVLREFTSTLLDGYTLEDIERETGAKVYVSRGGANLIDIIKEL